MKRWMETNHAKGGIKIKKKYKIILILVPFIILLGGVPFALHLKYNDGYLYSSYETLHFKYDHTNRSEEVFPYNNRSNHSIYVTHTFVNVYDARGNNLTTIVYMNSSDFRDQQDYEEYIGYWEDYRQYCDETKEKIDAVNTGSSNNLFGAIASIYKSMAYLSIPDITVENIYNESDSECNYVSYNWNGVYIYYHHGLIYSNGYSDMKIVDILGLKIIEGISLNKYSI